MSLNRRRFVLLCQQALACAVVVAVVAPSAGVITLDIVAPSPDGVGGGSPVRGALVASEPVAPDVREVRLSKTEAEQGSSRKQSVEAEGPALRWSARASTSLSASDDETAVSTAEAVEGYGSIGITWDGADEIDHDAIALEVRTLSEGTWSAWQEMHYDDDHGPDPSSQESYRAGTDAVVVGDVDDVQVRATSDGVALPSDMRLAIIDPGATVSKQRQQPAIDTGSLDSATLSSAGTGTLPPPADPATDPATDPGTDPGTDPTIAPAATLTAAKPEIFSRAQWGADERMRDKSSLRYGKITAGFVHHTVNANDYTAEQVPAIIRGIYAYHTQSRGWSDIGYNFLVDRFGRIWEGRYGGVDRPVVGAHTLNYNESSFAMSAIGNFETVQPSAALLDAYGRLFAWKLALHGVKASSTSQVVNGRTFQAINGHRDAGSTACPGTYLYAKLSTIRSLAASYQSGTAPTPTPPPPAPTPTPLDTNISGSAWPDFVVRDAATQQAYVIRTGGQVGFRGARRAASGFGRVDQLVGTWDLDGDGAADVLARDKASGVTTFYKGDGAGKLTAGATTKRFSSLAQMIGVGDFDGDGKADVVGKKAGKKKLLLYRGRGNGKFKKTRMLANPWSYKLVIAAGDSNRDGNADLYARDKNGKLWLLRGDGHGALKKARKLPGRWKGFDVIAGFGDLTNDGRVDLVARKKGSGRTFVYPAQGKKGFGDRFGGWTRFSGVRHLVSGGAIKSSGVDLLGVNAKGYLVSFANRQGRPLEAVVPAGTTFEDTNLVLTVGDWNRDGHTDVLTRSASTGDLMLRAGNGADGFAAPVLAGPGFGSVADLRAVGDINGDGAPDLAGKPAGGSARVYPGNGAGGFGASYVSKGPKNLARSVTSSRYDWRLPLGDIDGNKRKDLLVRERKSGTLWLLSGIKGGFDKPQFVAGGFAGYDLAG